MLDTHKEIVAQAMRRLPIGFQFDYTREVVHMDERLVIPIRPAAEYSGMSEYRLPITYDMTVSLLEETDDG